MAQNPRPSGDLLWTAAIPVLLAGSLFLFLPGWWRIAPLVLIAAVISGFAVRLSAPRPQPGPPSAGAANAQADPATPLVQVSEAARRVNRAFGPIVAGMIIDLVDFATFGPIGIYLGLPIGGLVGYWMGRCIGLGRRGSFLCALASGIYCTIPGTEFIPLATIVGACARFMEDRPESRKSGD